MFTTFFKKNHDNSDVFKKLIHRLSDMSVQDLEKIDRLLDIIFTPNQESQQLKTEATYREENFGRHIKGS
ncbi:ATPase [Streptococcus pneumoniae B1598]|nr:ATPase [Streptococcus pneumoniae B1598]